MTAQLAPIPIQKFFDNNGNPLFNGKLYSYVAGTSTPQATYTDSTMGTQNTNPIILNARGEANVWLDTTLSYKLVLQEANGTQIWAVDNIPGNGVFGTVQNIAALRNVTGVGVSNYQAIIVDGYTTAGDGGGGTFWWNSTSTVADNGGTIIAPTGVGTGRWYRLFSGWLNVLWFGAKGDGTTDDFTAIQNAITACPAQGTVFFPHPISNYYLANTHGNGIKLQSYLTLLGETSEIYMQPSTALVNVFYVTSATTNIIVKGFEFSSLNSYPHYNGWTGNTSNAVSINITDATNVIIEDCIFNNMLYDFFSSSVNGGNGVVISNIISNGCANVTYIENVSNLSINNIISTRPSIANSSTFDHHLYLDNCTNCSLSNIVCNGGAGYAVQFERVCQYITGSNFVFNGCDSGLTFGANNTTEDGTKDCVIDGVVYAGGTSYGINFGIGYTYRNIVSNMTVSAYAGTELIISQGNAAGWNKVTNIYVDGIHGASVGYLVNIATSTDLIVENLYIWNATDGGFAAVYSGAGVAQNIFKARNFIVYNDASHAPTSVFFELKGTTFGLIEDCLFYSDASASQGICFNTTAGTIIAKNVLWNSNWPGILQSGDTQTVPIDCSSISNVNGTQTTKTLISGTVYQNTNNAPIILYVPVTYNPTSGATATCAVALGSSSSPSTIYTISKPIGTGLDGDINTETLRVPNGWYYSFTVTNSTIGSATVIIGG